MQVVPRVILAVGLVIFAIAPAVADEQPVSFADGVAPILVDQCLVCHNTRTARGRFSVETFASLRKGGESGDAVTPGDGDFSNLVLLVESGEMPKDGAPLPAEQVALLKRWIDEGAKLDDGKPADRPLQSIMPPPVHPAPPAAYPAPLPVTALAFSPKASLLAVSGYHELLLFDPQTGTLARRIPNMAERIYGVAFSPDGERIAVAAGTPGRYGEVRLIRAGNGERIALLAVAADSILDVAFSPDGTKIAAAGADRIIRVWNAADGSEIARFEDHADWVTAVAISPDGKRIVSASRDKTAKVFDLESGETIVTFMEHEAAVHDAVFNHDGKNIASCGADGRLRIWDAATGKQEHSDRLDDTGLSLVPAGSEAFACGTAGGRVTIRGPDGKERHVFRDLPDWANAVAATRDGTMLAIGTADGTVTVVNIADKTATKIFPAKP